MTVRRTAKTKYKDPALDMKNTRRATPRLTPRERQVLSLVAHGYTSKQIGEKRSEEHTSELQSRLHLVCRLLLEKKKKKEKTISAGKTHSQDGAAHAPARRVPN